jgi:putative transcriptional regulator
MNSLQGHLLIAGPRLRDPNFRKSVVLLVQHTDEGALGLILNRPTGTSIKDIWGQVSKTPCETEEPLRLGGPCHGPLMALHTQARFSETEVLEGLYLCGDPEKLERLVAQKSGQSRYFVGYAGWSAGQLESELAEGSWLTAPARLDHVFHSGDEEADLWQRVTQELARSKVIASLKIKHVPEDPRLN